MKFDYKTTKISIDELVMKSVNYNVKFKNIILKSM